MRLRTMVMTVASLLAATGVATLILLGQAQAALPVASYTWSD